MSLWNSTALGTGRDAGGAWALSVRQDKGFRNPARFVSTSRRPANDLRATERGGL
jgi:hypothetical protein